MRTCKSRQRSCGRESRAKLRKSGTDAGSYLTHVDSISLLQIGVGARRYLKTIAKLSGNRFFLIAQKRIFVFRQLRNDVAKPRPTVMIAVPACDHQLINRSRAAGWRRHPVSALQAVDKRSIALFWIGSRAHAPDFEQNDAVAPDVTGTRVLAVVNSLQNTKA